MYIEFTRQLFGRETWKQLSRDQIALERNIILELEHLSDKIAQRLFESGSTLLPLCDIHSQKELQLISSIPINLANQQIKFIHKSMQEFFVSRAWMNWLACSDGTNGAVASAVPYSFSSNLVSQEAGILSFMAQQIQHERHTPELIKQVISSRHEKGKQQETASSNAMSILNAARFSFSGMDLSNISIPYANLQHAVMDQTDLSHSNLSGCNLSLAWMKRANLENCVMKNVVFGELPWLECDSDCISICCDEKLGLLITGHKNANIQVWDIAALKQVGESLVGHTASVKSVVTFEGKIVSGSDDNTIRVWDIATMKQIGEPLCGHVGGVTSVAVYDGKIVSGSDDNTIRVWDIATMKQIGEPLCGHNNHVRSVAILDGKIVSGGGDSIKVWDLTTMNEIGNILCKSVSIAAVVDGKIISRKTNDTLTVWDMATMKQIGEDVGGFPGFRQNTSMVIYDGKIVCDSHDNKIRVWDMATMKQIGDSLYDCVQCLAVYDGKIVSASWDNKIRFWDIETVKRSGDLLPQHRDVDGVAVVDDKIVSWGAGEFRVWDVMTMKQIGWHITKYYIRCGTVGNGMFVFVSDRIEVWDIAIMKQVSNLPGYGNGSTYAIAVMDGKIVFGGSGIGIHVWDMATMTQISHLQHPSTMWSIAAANGKIVVGWYKHNTIEVWDVATMKQIGDTLRGHTESIQSLLVVDNKIVSGSKDGIRVWNMDTMKQIGHLQGHADFAECFAVVNGNIVSGGWDTTIRVWDLTAMKQIGESLTSHTSRVHELAVIGNKIVSGSMDGTVQLWNITAGRDSLQAGYIFIHHIKLIK